MFKNTLLACVLLTSTQALAAVKCPVEKIQTLRTTEDKVFIQLEGQSWHVLAVKGEQDYNKKLARAMKAQRKDLQVELRFPNGYDETCMSSDTSVVAKKIKLIKKERY
ncbi:MAG: hypothetical protein MK193_15545 [Lentisphaeria bacterium]|nr:hypothetical protein [Lentisphaeria bacterium]